MNINIQQVRLIRKAPTQMVDPQVVGDLMEEGGEYGGGGASMLSPSWLPGGERDRVVDVTWRLPGCMT